MSVEATYDLTAKYDYDSKDPRELTIRKGEKLTLLDDSNEWWVVRNNSNTTGIVPSNFVQRQPKSKLSNIFRFPKAKRSSSGSIETTTVSSIGDEEERPFTGAKIADVVYVRFNYLPKKTDELNITKGEEISVLGKSSDGWWRGRKRTGQIGWFPSNYVQNHPSDENKTPRPTTATPPPLHQTTTATTTTTTTTTTNGQLTKHFNNNNKTTTSSNGLTRPMESRQLVSALYDYDATDGYSMSLKRWQKLRVISRQHGEWIYVETEQGVKGYVPANYVSSVEQEADEEKPFMINSTPDKSNGDSSSEPSLFSSSQSSGGQPVNGRTSNGRPSDDRPSDDRAPNGRLQQAQSTPIHQQIGASTLYDVDVELRESAYFYGRISRQYAETLLLNEAALGEYLVRESETNPGDLSISIKASQRVRHFRVVHDPATRDLLIGEHVFSSFNELIDYFTRNPIYRESDETAYLTRPFVGRPSV